MAPAHLAHGRRERRLRPGVAGLPVLRSRWLFELGWRGRIGQPVPAEQLRTVVQHQPVAYVLAQLWRHGAQYHEGRVPVRGCHEGLGEHHGHAALRPEGAGVRRGRSRLASGSGLRVRDDPGAERVPRVHVRHQGRYIVDGLVRRDQSSLFGAHERTAIYHRVSAAYRVTEDFTIPGVDELKLRIGHGTAGLRPPFAAQYETFAIVNGSPEKLTIGNTDLKP